MYVAITRAQKRLYLLHARSRFKNGKTVFNDACRYIDEIPEGVKESTTGSALIEEAQRALED